MCITEGIPAQDEALVYNTLVRDFPGTRLLGPNCPGIIAPGKCNIGITPSHIAKLPSPDGPNVGIVSRSGTLTYQALYELQQNGIGVSTCVGIGGDPVPGTSFVDCLAAFQDDPETHAMIMFGEIGGSAEEEAADFITANVTKPMSAYIAGVTAPAGKKMGHAGAIVSGGKGTAQGKMDALAAAGVEVGPQPDRGRRADGRHRREAAVTLRARQDPLRRTTQRPGCVGGSRGTSPVGGGSGRRLALPSRLGAARFETELKMALTESPSSRRFSRAPTRAPIAAIKAMNMPAPRPSVTSWLPIRWSAPPPMMIRMSISSVASAAAPRMSRVHGVAPRWIVRAASRNVITPAATTSSHANPPVKK